MADPHDDPPLVEAMVSPSAGRQLPDPPDTGGAMEFEEEKESCSCGENGGCSGGGEGEMEVTPSSSDCTMPAADSQDCASRGAIAVQEDAGHGRAPPAPFGCDDEAAPSGLEDGATPPAPEIVLVAHTHGAANDATDLHHELAGDDRDGAWLKAIEARDCLSLMNILNAQDLDKASRVLLCLKEGEQGRTALHVAAMQGCFRLAKQLIDLVCEKHPYVEDGHFLVFFSRDGIAHDVCLSWISYDFIYGEDGRSGLAAFEMANDIIGHTSISRYILHVAMKDSEDRKYSGMYEAYEGTEWHSALARGDCRELELLLECNSRCLLETCGGLSVLDVAILKGDDKLVKQVMGLFWAASDGDLEICWHEELYFPSKLTWEQIAKRSLSLKSAIVRDWFPDVKLREDLQSVGSALELAEKLGRSEEIKGLLLNVAGHVRDSEKSACEDGDQDLLRALIASGLLETGVSLGSTGEGEPIELEALESRLPEFQTLLLWARNIEKHWDRKWTAEFLVDVDYNFEDKSSLRFSMLRLHYACKHIHECLYFLESVLDETRCREEFHRLQVDGQGRTPWHTMVDYYNPEDIDFDTCRVFKFDFLDLSSDSRGRSVLERAISKQFLEQESVVSSHLLQHFEKDKRSLIVKASAHEKLRDRSPNKNISMFHWLYLASFLLEDVHILRLLTSEEEHEYEIKAFLNTVHVGAPRVEVPGSTGLFIAAALGNQTLLREWFKFKSDCMVEDSKGRTALHYAADANALERISLPTSFFCSVDYPKKVDKEWMNRRKGGGANPSAGQHVDGNPQSNASVGRKACILMLLQAGVDLSQVDKKKNIAEPGASSNTEFLSWWYDLVAKDSDDKKSSFNQAGNALSVVGTLVAATSYIGPLQPPLNYSHNGYVDTYRSLVKVFMWTNTLAFYLAVASVMFAVVPSLPMPQEGTIDELRRARHTVLSSLFLLLASIICILVSFAAATAVVVDHGDYYGANDFLLSPSVIGWFFCLIAMVSFFIRVMRLVFYRNPTIRQIYTFSISGFLKRTLKRSGGALRRTCWKF